LFSQGSGEEKEEKEGDLKANDPYANLSKKEKKKLKKQVSHSSSSSCGPRL
jgi:ATP-binding cassette subfamily F protein 1